MNLNVIAAILYIKVAIRILASFFLLGGVIQLVRGRRAIFKDCSEFDRAAARDASALFAIGVLLLVLAGGYYPK